MEGYPRSLVGREFRAEEIRKALPDSERERPGFGPLAGPMPVMLLIWPLTGQLDQNLGGRSSRNEDAWDGDPVEPPKVYVQYVQAYRQSPRAL